MPVRGEDRIMKSFDAKSRVEIKTVSGDCLIKTADIDKIEVDLTYDYRPSSAFEPVFSERGDRLIIEESMSGSNRGNALWTITVPPKTEIRFRSASGNFEAKGLRGRVNIRTASGQITLGDIKGELELESASGDIELNDISGELVVRSASGRINANNIDGDIELKDASGNIEIDNIKGILEIGNASGDIDAAHVTLGGRCTFASASGDARVVLAQTPDFDLEVSSASGSAFLDFGGNSIRGEVEMSARLDEGTIKSPIKFETEETFTRGRQDYIRKTFIKGDKSPFISIRTASGRAVLQE